MGRISPHFPTNGFQELSKEPLTRTLQILSLSVISSQRARQINLAGTLISSGNGGRTAQWRGSVPFPLAGRIYPARRRKRLANGRTTKALYRHFRTHIIGPHLRWKLIWPLPFPSKQKMFLWKCLHGWLPIMGRLHRFFPGINPTYGLRHLQPE